MSNTMQVIDMQMLTDHHIYLILPPTDERVTPDYNRKGDIRPDKVHLRWVFPGDTQTWRLSKAEVSGPQVKKNGEDSQNRASRDFAGFGSQSESMPSWLTDLVERYETTLPTPA